jgi:hypothetical protein
MPFKLKNIAKPLLKRYLKSIGSDSSALEKPFLGSSKKAMAYQLIRHFVSILVLVTATATWTFAAPPTPGDINHDLKIDLTDIILALQVSVGMSSPAMISPGADVDGDLKIGIAEALYAAHAVTSVKDINTYSLLGANGTLTGTAIAITLPEGTDLTALIATFSATGGSVKVGNTVQVSGSTPNNFTTPLVYTVTAADGSTKIYTVTVTIATSGPTIGGCPVFPATAIFNSRIDNISQFPVHASSAAWKSSIDATGERRLHLDWGMNENPSLHDTYWGIPYNVVDGITATTTWPITTYNDGWPDESDCVVANGSGGYNLQYDCSAVATPRLPIPTNATIKVEGGYCPVGMTCPDGDHHILVVETATCRLWEAYHATPGSAGQSANGSWDILSSAAWDLNSLAQRPAGWTSGDAAGLPILPLLARVDEANAGEVKHALRITLRSNVMAKSYVWPARHQAGRDSGSIPFGALMRLKESFVIPANWNTQAKALATAMKRYGVYVADNGSDMYIQGEPSGQWQETTWDQLQSIALSQFDFVSLDSITSSPGFDANSMAASW